MSLSIIDICNRALGRIGAKRITSFSDGSEEAKTANLEYAATVDEVLRAHSWGFCTKVEALSQLANESVPGWGYVYQYPPKCQIVRKLFASAAKPDEIALPYRIFLSADATKKTIACDSTPVYIEYSFDVTDPGLYDPMFVDAIVARLASKFAIPLTGDTGKAQQMAALYGQIIAEAQRVNLTETDGSSQKKPSSGYINARG